ncbi:MAG: hypothetical protein KGL53_11895 [Elusimicrobia bacterium]|nr:hypothetical protein [Elusimicrobiota bacterium]
MRFVTFSLKAPAAKSVRLAASFNGFDPKALGLTRGKGGLWSTTVPLAPGSYQYVFDVDGTWTTDPAAPGTARRGGKSVSVRSVR